MQDIFSMIKIIAITQVIIVMLLLLFSYAIKIYAYYKERHIARITRDISKILTDSISNKEGLTAQRLLPYKNQNIILLDIIEQWDTNTPSDAWTIIREHIIQTIILPKARIFAKSGQWYKRYIACLSFQLSLTKQDENQIKILVNDSVKLISINAAILAMRYHSKDMLDAVIDYFSSDRRVQQSLVSQVIAGADAAIIPLIIERIKREKNPYVKAFCYRLLMQLPFSSESIDTVDQDVNSSTQDLRLSAIDYSFHHDSKASTTLLMRLLKDEHWEVRAKSAKLLGKTGDPSFAAALEDGLKDREWWVRINTAEALVALGKKGLSILKRQSPDIDQYAYDIATQVININRLKQPVIKAS
jgi:hypothetical protein